MRYLFPSFGISYSMICHCKTRYKQKIQILDKNYTKPNCIDVIILSEMLVLSTITIYSPAHFSSNQFLFRIIYKPENRPFRNYLKLLAKKLSVGNYIVKFIYSHNETIIF